MKYARVKSEFNFPDQTVLVGTILPVDDEPNSNGLLFILGGKFANRSVHVDHLEGINPTALVNELEDLRKQSSVLCQREARYISDLARAGQEIARLEGVTRELYEKNDRQREALNRIVNALGGYGPVDIPSQITSLKEQIKALNKDREMLLELIEREADNKKTIELPTDVAKAIENLKNSDFSNFGIIHFIDRPEEIKNQFDSDNFKVLRHFTLLDTRKYLGGCELLMRALVNGYTVAPEPLPFVEDKAAVILTEVRALVEKWWRAIPPFGGNSPTQILTETICDYIQQREELPF